MAHISSPDSPFSLRLDPSTGLPIELTIEDQAGTISREISVELTAELGGTERRHPTGGLLYENTDSVSELKRSEIGRAHV